jgi:hypothetical protein
MYFITGEAVEWKHAGQLARDVGSYPSGGTFISKKPKMKKPRVCPPVDEEEDEDEEADEEEGEDEEAK